MVKHNKQHRQSITTNYTLLTCDQSTKSTFKAWNNSNGIFKMNQLKKIEVGLGKSMQCRKSP